MNLDNVEVFGQNSIKINSNKVMYIDPLFIDNEYNDADIVFITHDHFDHFSPKDIEKVSKSDTIYILPEKMKDSISKLNTSPENVKLVIPNQQYEIKGIKFNTVPSYNIVKQFHPKANNWVGYLLDLDYKYYIAGDTDDIDEIKHLDCDVAFVPIGGTYTMDYSEAAELINTMKPQVAIPVHYGSIVGNKEDGNKFKELLDKNIECKIVIE